MVCLGDEPVGGLNELQHACRRAKPVSRRKAVLVLHMIAGLLRHLWLGAAPQDAYKPLQATLATSLPAKGRDLTESREPREAALR